MTVYEWGTRFNSMQGVSIDFESVNAESFAALLQNLEEKHGGATPEAIVDASRSRRSKTHKLFNWDDTQAAERYRCEQAKLATRSLRVVVEEQETGKEERVRAFHSVKVVGSGHKSHYRSLESVMNDPLSREEVLQECLRELIHWRKKWAQLNEIADKFAAIDGTIRSLQKAVAKG